MDFHFLTTKLQPGFCASCVLQCFSRVETEFFIDVLSNSATSSMSRATLVVESAHRLSHLLSTLHICKVPICELDRASPNLLNRFVELLSFYGAPIVRNAELS